MAEPAYSLMKMPAGELLNAFGAGSHMPGAGSAAALMGLVAGKLLLSVGKQSLKNPKYEDRAADIERLVGAVAGRIEPALRRLFERDSVLFDEVIALRHARDAEADADKKADILRQLDALMREATELPLRIGELCLDLVDQAGAMFDIGAVAGRGDSGAAISAAAGGAMSAVFIVGSNLQSCEPGAWLDEQTARLATLRQALREKQRAGYARVDAI